MTESSPASRTVFLSYANADRARVEPLVTALEAEGLDVWWDREIPRGQSYNRVIEAALDQATCALVIWSQSSVTSEWVFNEASESRKRQILVPVLIDDVEPPLEFRHLQSARLVEWGGDRSDPEWSGLLAAVHALVQPPSHAATRVAGAASTLGPGRPWWHTPAGAAAGAGALLVGVALLLMALNQVGLIGGRSTPDDRSTGAAVGGPTVSPQDAAPTPTPESATVGQPTAVEATAAAVAASTERVNLLDPAQGGKIVIANQVDWRNVIETRPSTAVIVQRGFAVFAFRDNKPVVIDAIGVFVESSNAFNLKELAVSASDGSETGPFRTIASVTVPNYRNMQGPVHVFPLPPFSARYVKVEPLQWQNVSTDGVVGYVGSLQLFGKPQ